MTLGIGFRRKRPEAFGTVANLEMNFVQVALEPWSFIENFRALLTLVDHLGFLDLDLFSLAYAETVQRNRNSD